MNNPKGDAHWTRRRPERVRTGVEASGAKLTEAEIEEIVFLHTQYGSPQGWLARRYGVSRATVWRHVTKRCADVNT